MAIFGRKPWVNPLGKMSIFGLFGLLVFIDQKGVFSFQNIIKDIFLAYIAEKKRSWKSGHFWTKTLSKSVNFQTFGTFCFQSLERRFLVLEYHKRHFPGIYHLKKNLEKMPFLDQNHGFTPQQKCQFLDILDLLFLQPKKAFFRSRIS